MRQELQTGNRSIFSRRLQETLSEMKNRQQQGILFVPRRGHSTFVSCRNCGWVIECPHCDVSLSYHYTQEGTTQLLRCHYCNHASLHPEKCLQCGSPYLKFFGSGTQKVTQELEKLFPEMRSIRFDSDTTNTKGAHRQLLDSFARQEADLLVGTQMLTKGIDLERVTLVGIVAADGLLNRADYRATERAFQTLTQVAGRAGRGEELGRVILQTYSPEHPAIQAVRDRNWDNFVKQQLVEREELNYPPYGRLMAIKLSGLDNEEVRVTAEAIVQACADIEERGCEILGPAPAVVMRVADRYRWNILLKFSSGELQNAICFAAAQAIDIEGLRSLCPRSISMTIDVDPLNID
jgi:primosomal protein N' (replication factor Y)